MKKLVPWLLFLLGFLIGRLLLEVCPPLQAWTSIDWNECDQH